MEMNIFKNLHQEKMMELSEATSDMEKARINGYLDAVDDLENYFRKHRWHDLRKNPNDLPDKYKGVYVCICNKGKKTYNRSWFDGYAWHHSTSKTRLHYMDKSVIAWRHIEPFEVEE